MSTRLVDLLPALSDLDRAEKFNAMSFLIGELAKDEAVDLSSFGPYPVWTPHGSFEVAQVLLDALASEARGHG